MSQSVRLMQVLCHTRAQFWCPRPLNRGVCWIQVHFTVNMGRKVWDVARCPLNTGFTVSQISTTTTTTTTKAKTKRTSHENHRLQQNIPHCLIQRRISLQYVFPPNHASALTGHLSNSNIEWRKVKTKISNTSLPFGLHLLFFCYHVADTDTIIFSTFCLLNVCENVLTPSTTAWIDSR